MRTLRARVTDANLDYEGSIVLTYVALLEEASSHRPRLAYGDGENRILKVAE